MATIQIKRRTSAGSGPLTGATGIVRAGEPQVDFSGGNLYIAKSDKTASSGNPLVADDYMEIPSTFVVNNLMTAKINAIGLGSASYRNIGTGNGNVPILDSSGKLADSVIPKIAMTNTFVVASQSAMLALSTAQEGDVAIRTDASKSYILTSSSYSTLSAWQELLTPTDAVSSVNGKTGTVNINLTELGGVSSSTFNSHTGDTSKHLSTDQITKINNGLNTHMNCFNAASYEAVESSFRSKVLSNGLILYSFLDTTYNPYRRIYAYGIDKNAVLTPSSIIDGGTY